MRPLTGSLEALEGNGRQALRDVAIGVCILLEDEVQATYDDCRKAACIESMSAGPDSD